MTFLMILKCHRFNISYFKKETLQKLVVLLNQKQYIYYSSKEGFKGDRLQHRTLR